MNNPNSPSWLADVLGRTDLTGVDVDSDALAGSVTDATVPFTRSSDFKVAHRDVLAELHTESYVTGGEVAVGSLAVGLLNGLLHREGLQVTDIVVGPIPSAAPSGGENGQ